MAEQKEQLDVLIIGAGISGLGMCYTMTKKRPGESFAVIESRENFGGTWDLFKYPGIRSDSDMYTFAYSFKPWRHREYIGSAQRINQYLQELVDDNGLRQHIRFKQRVLSLDWHSETSTWTTRIRRDDGVEYCIEAKFVVSCTGYYNYDDGYLPQFMGYDDYKGKIIHPQKWPEDYDYTSKRITVIGSGATAVTLVPALTDKAKHVTMLQRSPSYIYSRPAADGLFRLMNNVFPARFTNRVMRIKYVLLQQLTYFLSKRFPEFVSVNLRKTTAKLLNHNVDVDVHFKPKYKPWDQRVCMVPDNDLFEKLNDGSASIVTDEIERFTEKGILLKSGQEIESDVIVTATGLDILIWGGMQVTIDEQKVIPNSLTNYKGMMFCNIPNMLTIFGYTNSSWTLKAELTYGYVDKLLTHMKTYGYKSVYPYLFEEQLGDGINDLTSGYLMRAQHKLPKQGFSFPWRNKDFYLKDLLAIKYHRLADGVLRFDDTDHLKHFHQTANKKRQNPDSSTERAA